MFRNRLFLAAAVFGGMVSLALVGSAQAAPPARATARPPVIVNRPVVNPAIGRAPVIVNRPATPVIVNRPNHMPGWDWWRTYPYSSYNAWRNPYWYYPYTPYVVPGYYNNGSAYPAGYEYYNLPLPPVPAIPPVPGLN